MRKEYAGEEIKGRVIDLFEARRESEEPARMSLGELVREGARLMLERALDMEVESFLGRKRYRRGNRTREGYRNGSSERTVKTLAGEVTVRRAPCLLFLFWLGAMV